MAVILLIAGSVMSATMLIPDRAEIARAEAALAGITSADLCGDEAGHQHHCPFCKLLPNAGGISQPERATRMRPVDHWRMAEHIYRGAQARDNARSPRAPPAHS